LLSRKKEHQEKYIDKRNKKLWAATVCRIRQFIEWDLFTIYNAQIAEQN